MEMEGEHPNIRPQRDFKSGETQSEERDWEVTSTDDPLGEGVGPGGQRPSPSVCSMKSDQSKERPPEFTGESKHTRVDLYRPDSLSSMSSSCKLSDNSTPVDEASSQHTTEPTGVPCAVCPKRASKSCLTCTASFCEVHVKQHYTAPALQRHTLVDATEDLEQRLCQRHNRDREIYCKTDQISICLSCLITEHNGHDIIPKYSNQYLQKNKSKMEKNKSEMENKTAVPPPGPIEFTSVKPDSVCLSWGPPEGLAGPHRFRVTRFSEGNQQHFQVQDLKLHVQGLTAGEEYLFTVATLSDDGRLSSCVSATVHTAVPPPRQLNVWNNFTSVSVTWIKPEGVVQASYLLTLHRDGGCLNTISTSSLQHRYEMEMEAEYTISVSTVLNGGQSKPISKTITTSYPVPEIKAVRSVTPTSADLSWSLHQGMEQFPHSFLISYLSEETELQTISTESCSTTLTGLMPDTNYTVTVCCELRDGGRSQAATHVFQTAVPPPGPIEFTSVKPDSVCLSWGPPEGLAGPHRFRVTWSGEGSLEHVQVQDLKLDVQGLTPREEYLFTVSTLSEDDRPSSCVSATVCTDTPPPECLTVAVDLTSVSVTWSKPEGVVQASYLLTLHRDGGCLNTVSTRSLQHRYELEMDREYTINVSTVLKRVQSKPISQIIRLTVPHLGPIEFTSVKPDSVCVSWGPPEGLAGPHRFRVTWSGEGSQEHLEVQGLKLHVQELTPGEKYLFTVATLTDDGRLSSCVSATVLTDVPPPRSLSISKDSTSVSVTWSKPEGVDQASYLLTLHRDGGCIKTISTRSLQHRYEFEMEGEYTINVSTLLKGVQSKPISKSIQSKYNPHH